MESITIITIEGMQAVSTALFVAAGILAVLAVILFIRFDIRHIWGLIVRHTPQSAHQKHIIEEQVDIDIASADKVELKKTAHGKDVWSTQLLKEEIQETKYLNSEIQDNGFLEVVNVNTVPLENKKTNIQIIQDITYVHTDIQINKVASLV